MQSLLIGSVTIQANEPREFWDTSLWASGAPIATRTSGVKNYSFYSGPWDSICDVDKEHMGVWWIARVGSPGQSEELNSRHRYCSHYT